MTPRRILVLAIVIPLLLMALLFWWASRANAADRPEKPSALFCVAARTAVVAAGSERAAEAAARAQGLSEATIQRAKRCPR